MELTEKAREIFANDRYATELTGVKIDHVGDRCATCSLMLDARHRNAKGAVMGGVLFTLADLAFAVAANSTVLSQTPAGEEVRLCWVSASSDIHFVSVAKGNKLTATSRCMREGRTRALYQCEIHDSEGRLVAVATTEASCVNV